MDICFEVLFKWYIVNTCVTWSLDLLMKIECSKSYYTENSNCKEVLGMQFDINGLETFNIQYKNSVKVNIDAWMKHIDI